jgi:hypothetical protein
MIRGALKSEYKTALENNFATKKQEREETHHRESRSLVGCGLCKEQIILMCGAVRAESHVIIVLS